MKLFICGGLMAGLLFVPFLAADDKEEPKKKLAPVKIRTPQDPKVGGEKAEETDPRKQAWNELRKEMIAKSNEVRAKYAAAKDEKEKEAIIKEFQSVGISVPRGMALAKQKPGDEVSRDILYALAARPGLAKLDPDDKKWVLETLDKHHLKAAQAETLASMLCQQLTPDGEKLVNKIRQEHPLARVRAMSTFSFARAIKQQSELTSDNPEREELSTKALGLFEELTSKEFAEVKLGNKTIKDIAGDSIFELKFLAIGKTAPEITAEDIDGVTFKLSDYRGKVLVLDFWGDW
ncbi:MAG: redoxin domain-containing protein [Gemmataceae bacterium]|nr:redoxin domain-containing protein [Gemmataceae bacterium]